VHAASLSAMKSRVFAFQCAALVSIPMSWAGGTASAGFAGSARDALFYIHIHGRGVALAKDHITGWAGKRCIAASQGKVHPAGE
jgi:hypothetical protein